MDLNDEIESYISENWERIVQDIDTLVRIPSVEDLTAASPDAPYGAQPAQALDAALAIAQRLGLDAHNCEGRIGYADLHGDSDTQIAIIGHVDVVPAGPGWAFPPFEVTRKDGYLVGRGVADDKGPTVVAMHAAGFWQQKLKAEGRRFPYTLRMLIGANEETGMGDVAYYRRHYNDPAFLFTPDADFPVGYGEAGICHGALTSAPIRGGNLLELSGGVAVNAVPGEARALIACADVACPQEDGIDVTHGDGTIEVRAYGKSAHASTPELGVNAIDKLAAYLLDADLLSAEERAFFELVRMVTSCSDGSGVGLQCSDDHFGDLTAVGSMIEMERVVDGSPDGAAVLRLMIDIRYPTSINSDQIAQRINAAAAPFQAKYSISEDKPTYLMNPDSPEIQALNDAYCLITGEKAEPFALKGGTYAREFAHAASFGPEKSWESKPAWTGTIHAADEAIGEDILKQSLAIYIHAIGNLMELDL